MHHWCLKKQIKETIPSNTTIDIKVLNTQNIAQIASFAEWFCILMLPWLLSSNKSEISQQKIIIVDKLYYYNIYKYYLC